jgi:hypothetical protein
MLRTIFGPKREEVVEGWISPRNEGLHNVYASPDIRVTKSRSMKLPGHVARVGEMRNASNIFVGKPEGRRPVEKPRRRREDIRMDHREGVWKGVNWIYLA